MSEETRLHLEGELRSGDFFLELHTAQGAKWDLDRTSEALPFVGQRVEVVGERIGFNDLRVAQIWPAGTPRPRQPRLTRGISRTVAIVALFVLAILLLRLA